MSSFSKNPAYNLKVVIQEADIKPDTLLVNYDVPPEVFPEYLKVCRQALEQYLDEQEQPIINWITQKTEPY